MPEAVAMAGGGGTHASRRHAPAVRQLKIFFPTKRIPASHKHKCANFLAPSRDRPTAIAPRSWLRCRSKCTTSRRRRGTKRRRLSPLARPALTYDSRRKTDARFATGRRRDIARALSGSAADRRRRHRGTSSVRKTPRPGDRQAKKKPLRGAAFEHALEGAISDRRPRAARHSRPGTAVR
ncbi:hypothetical protein CKY51_00935 [Xanthomonas maliensis]|nr:hypothetical protein CKY51_00935 [Xanthomonas maliensis]